MELFDAPAPRVASRVKALEIRLLISEDDVPEVLAVTGVAAEAAIPAVPAVEAVAEETDADGNVTVEAVDAVAGVAAVPPVEAVAAVEGVAAYIATSINCHMGYKVLDADGEVLRGHAGELTSSGLPPTLKDYPEALLTWAFAKAKKNL